MAKVKSPVLSLEARGTLGDSITFARRRRVNIAERKPIPAYRRTLPQVYQRWLYEDYAYLWRQQSLATRQSYHSLGTRHHLTGFQYWMKYQLTNLPDILGWWKLDEGLGAIAVDSSRNENHGVIIGASPTAGIIGRARHFDALNDSIGIATFPSLAGSTAFTIRAWVYWTGGSPEIVDWRNCVNIQGTFRFFYIPRNNNVGTFHLWGLATLNWIATLATFQNVWRRVAATFDGTTIRCYTGGVLDNSVVAPGALAAPTQPLFIGEAWPGLGDVFDGSIDSVILNDRVLDETELLRDAGRSYPA